MLDFSPEGIASTLLSLPVILFSLSLHEYAHGYIANKLGDPTAKNLGRLTLDPLKHLDPIGFICMLLFGFGWAKPVMINSRNFKKPRRDMALSAIAGPIANLILGFVFMILTYIAQDIIYSVPEWAKMLFEPFSVPSLVFEFLSRGALLNVYLAVFNLLPIPPFDGSRFFYIFLPVKWYFGIMKYERIIMIVMLILLWTDVLTIPLSLISGYIIEGMMFILKGAEAIIATIISYFA
jgi:Zn-dependent protease